MTYREMLNILHGIPETDLDAAVKYFDLNEGISLDVEMLLGEDVVDDEGVRPDLPLIISR